MKIPVLNEGFDRLILIQAAAQLPGLCVIPSYEVIMFEYSIVWDKEKFQKIYQNKDHKHNWKAIILFLFLGGMFLLSSYTLILGVLIIILTIFISFLGSTLSKYTILGFSSIFESHKHMHEPLKYGVTEFILYVKGEKIDSKCSWENLMTWQIRENWFILRPSGIPQIFFPIDELKKANAFESILEAAKKHGKEFKK